MITEREVITGKCHKEVEMEKDRKYPCDLETQRLLPLSRISVNVWGRRGHYIGRRENGF